MDIENIIQNDDFKLQDLLSEEKKPAQVKKKAEKTKKKKTSKVNNNLEEGKTFYGAALMNSMRMEMENVIVNVDLAIGRDKTYKTYGYVKDGKFIVEKIEEV